MAGTNNQHLPVSHRLQLAGGFHCDVVMCVYGLLSQLFSVLPLVLPFQFWLEGSVPIPNPRDLGRADLAQSIMELIRKWARDSSWLVRVIPGTLAGAVEKQVLYFPWGR